MVVDHRDVGAAFRRLSLPIALTMLGDQVLGVVDTIAIGSLGSVALAGITGASAVFITVLFGLFGFGSGLSIVAAQRIGAGDVDGFGSAVRAGTVAPLLCAIAALTASIFLAEPVLHLVLRDLPSLHPSANYLVLRCISLVPMMITLCVITGIGAAGNRVLAVHTLLLINAIHVPLVLILALGWGTHHALGITGAGISSLVSEIAGAIFLIMYTLRHPQYRIFASLQIDMRLVRQTVRLSLPEVVFLVAILFPDTFIVAMLAPLGAVTISAFRALNVVSDFTFVAVSPLQEATQTVIGQRLGARDFAGAGTFFVEARRFALKFSTLTAVIVAALAWPLAYVFTLNAAVASLAAIPLALHMLTLPLKGYAMVSMSPLRASGDTRFSMFAGLLCSILVLPITWAGITILHIGLYAVPLAWISAWAARAVLTHLRLRRDDWMHRELSAA